MSDQNVGSVCLKNLSPEAQKIRRIIIDCAFACRKESKEADVTLGAKNKNRVQSHKADLLFTWAKRQIKDSGAPNDNFRKISVRKTI